MAAESETINLVSIPEDCTDLLLLVSEMYQKKKKQVEHLLDIDCENFQEENNYKRKINKG